MKKSVFAFFAACLCVHAHALERRFTDGPHAGLVTGGDTQGEEFLWGWQAAYDFNRNLTVELSYSRHSDHLPQRDVVGLGLPPGSGVEIDVNNIGLTGRWHWHTGNYHSLYLGAGTSYYLMNEDVTETNRAIHRNRANSIYSDFSTEIHAGFGFHVAAGLEISLHRNWELFGEYRFNNFTADLEYDLVRTAGNGDLVTTTVEDELSYDHGMIRFGLNYRF